MIQNLGINLSGIMPPLVLCITGLVVLVVGWFIRKGVLAISAILSLIGLAVSCYVTWPFKNLNEDVFSGFVVVDTFSWFLNIVILIAAALTVLISVRYFDEEGLSLYEYFVLLLFSTAGMMFMISGNHILVIFIGLETFSIAIYVLAGALPISIKSKEAALKYLVLGAFSSGIFLYGSALLYGSAGSLSLPALAKYFQAGQISLMAKVGMGLLMIGFTFKIAAVPFHMWTPDVYDGAPTPLTAFMSVGVKAAAFAAFLRVFFESLTALQVNWTEILWVLAFLTMIVGNLAALVQENIKRMLAYSSIAHAGYILIGMVAGGENGTSGMLYYLLAYAFTSMGAFGVVALVGRKGESNIMIDDYRGLSKSNPLLAATMAIFMFSLAGIPPTAGFIGKLAIFKAAIVQGYIWLIIVAVLTSAISVYYYFRVVMKMYMEAPEIEPQPLRIGFSMIAGLAIAVAGVLYMGIVPGTYLGLALESVKPLF